MARQQRSLRTKLCHRSRVAMILRQPEESQCFLMSSCWNPGVSIRRLNNCVTGTKDYFIQKRGITSNGNHNWSRHLHKLAIFLSPFFKTHPYSMHARWARWRDICMLNFSQHAVLLWTYCLLLLFDFSLTIYLVFHIKIAHVGTLPDVKNTCFGDLHYLGR